MSLVGSSTTAHALKPGDKVIWRQRDGVCTVLVVKEIHLEKMEHAIPFYRSSFRGGSDADFTHVVIAFKGMPWPCIFGPGSHLEQYHDRHYGDDY